MKLHAMDLQLIFFFIFFFSFQRKTFNPGSFSWSFCVGSLVFPKFSAHLQFYA